MSSLIYSKMNSVMKEIKSVGKDSTNTQQGFKFRGIDAFINSLYPALVKHGVFMTTEVLTYKTELKEVTRSNGKEGVDSHAYLLTKYTFHAEDGSSVSSTVASEGLDSGDKATNKALSAGLKYALIQTLSVPTEDMEEGDFTSPEAGVTAGKDKKASPKAKAVATPTAEATNVETTPTPAITVSTETPKRPAFFKPTAKAAAPTSSNNGKTSLSNGGGF